METVLPVMDTASRLWNMTASRAFYLIRLEDSLKYLKMEMEHLEVIRDEYLLQVQSEGKGMKLTRHVEIWLNSVEKIQHEVKEVLAEKENTGRNLFRFGSSYKLNKKSKKLILCIEELIRTRPYLELSIEQPLPALVTKTKGFSKIPMPIGNHWGMESNLANVLEGLRDENVGIIGLYGMAGVGKTLLLKYIYNELPDSGDDAFDCVLWIMVSKNATIEKIQQNIMAQLKITLSNNSEDEICTEIYRTLKNKKYILMLDDVWEMIDLFEGVGIPKPDNENRSKIIITSRSKGVCFKMGAHLITEVQCLSWEDAWSLFQEKVGKATLGPHIESYARKVAEECNGIPLALITIGRAMSGKVEPCEWSHALYQLQNYPAEIPNLEFVFRALQLSYDYLADSTKQKCFLYCSLFPEDHEIDSEELVDLWMGEGYLNKIHDIKKARDYGYSIIEDLKHAGLLGSGSYHSEKTVKMHNVIREMALWIAKKEFLFLDMAKIMKAKSNDQDWNEDVEKMSLWKKVTYSYKTEEGSSSKGDQDMLLLTRKCPNLSTLLVRGSLEVSFSGIINLIPNVRVLSLSGSIYITQLPKEISKLENLEYLNISKTRIRRLPAEMRRLHKLRYLHMNSMLELEEFPAEIISGLEELLVFSMDDGQLISEELLRLLENLQHIQQISLVLDSAETMNYLMKSEKLQLCTRNLLLQNTFEVLTWCPTNMRNLESLAMILPNLIALKFSSPSRMMIFQCLCYVEILSCDCLVELDFLGYAPFLIELEVGSCISLQRILHMEEAESVFLSLKYMYLSKLPNLEMICNKSLSFPTLETIEISDCPKLQQNPFNDMVLTNISLRKIKGDMKWWDSLNWINDELKEYMKRFFIPSSVTYNTKQDKKVDTFIYEMDSPSAKSDEVIQRASLSEQQGIAQTSDAMDGTDEKVRIIEDDAQFTGNTSTIEDVKNLLIRVPEVEIQQPRSAATKVTMGWCEIPMEDQHLFGIEFNLDKVLEGLRDNNVGIIGLYGMQGVGKTTLLKKFNNELPKSGDDDFDWAFWVVASRHATIQTIQHQILGILKIPYETLSDNSVDGMRNEILKALNKRKFILMLDDVWEMLDLFQKVGIPKTDSHNKSKIIFTTRFKDVCSQMGAHLIIAVNCLPWEQAWSLFQEYVTEADWSTQIETYAMEIAKECKGLPLALITMGTIMSSKKDPREWSQALEQLKNSSEKSLDLNEDMFHEDPREWSKALEQLKNSPARSLNLNEDVFHEDPRELSQALEQLKNSPAISLDPNKDVFYAPQHSYDNLGDLTIKQCFLYCCLFPKDYMIPSDKLVDLWMGEGYLNKTQGIKNAREYGYSIISDLKSASLLDSVTDSCLLVNGSSHLFELLKMSDENRDMALRIAGKTFLVLEKAGLMKARSNDQDWNEVVEKMSSWGTQWEKEKTLYDREEGSSSQRDEEKLTLTLECPKLSTLLCILSPRVCLSELLNFIPNVKVLDLSENTNVMHLPEGISKLEKLEYFDISKTGIRRLPKEMKSLMKLRYLLMNSMFDLEEFPTEIISGLKDLLVFRLDYSQLFPEELLRGLQELQNIQEIKICLGSAETTNFLLKSEKLLLCTTHLQLGNTSEVLRWCPAKMKNLESLFLKESNLIALKCTNPTTLMVFSCLRSVHVLSCGWLVELDILAYAPNLIKLEVGHCRSIQRILHLEKANSVFLSLKDMRLDDLPSLEIICNKSLSFPALETIEIRDCPKLRNPFNDMMAANRNLRKIKGDREWWDSLHWIDRKQHYSKYLTEYIGLSEEDVGLTGVDYALML